jgi:hypothetical protein
MVGLVEEDPLAMTSSWRFFQFLLRRFGSRERIRSSEAPHPPSNPGRLISSIQSNTRYIDSIKRIDIEYKIGLTLFPTLAPSDLGL